MKIMQQGADEVAEKTNDRVRFRFYPGGVMGDDATVLRKIRIGQLQGGALLTGALADDCPALRVYGLPLKFRSFAEVDYIRSRLDPVLLQELEKSGWTAFGLADGGFAYIMSNAPLRTVDELRQQKVWVPDNHPVAREIAKTFDLSPIPLSIADVLAGLQTGLVDTVAVSPVGAIALQWHTRVKYMTDIPIIYLSGTLAVSNKYFKRISPEDQQVVRQVMGRAFAEIDRLNREDAVEAREALLKQGVEIVRPDTGQLGGWYTQAEETSRRLIEAGDLPEGPGWKRRINTSMNIGPESPDEAVPAGSRLGRALALVEDFILAAMLAAMIALSFSQIVLRNIFESGLIWGDSLVRVMVLWICLIGALSAGRDGKHISIDVISRFLPEKGKAAADAVTQLFTAAVCLLLAWHSLALVRLEYQDGYMAFASVPAWVCEAIIPIGLAGLGLRYLVHTGRSLARLIRTRP